MPDNPKNPDSLGDGQTLSGKRKAPAKSKQSLGDTGTRGGGLDSSISDVGDIGDMADLDLPLIDLAARFEMEEELGKGGMGVVQLATDRQLKRKVAIKRIHAISKSALARFVTEAQSIAALSHFNIVQIHEFGRDQDGPLLVMEYVSGGSLLDRLKEGKLEVEEAIDITCQLCDALAVAHEQGIIHRDIKPANILLTTRGEPKLTDFGLARQESVDHGQTQAGAVLGTIDFMPPEQRRDATAVNASSDLWSLAATCYQMVTGEAPRVIDLDTVPQNLRSTFAKALKQNPSERFSSAEEFKTNLKKSMTSVAVDLAAGICPACNTANDVSRKFCRGCRAALIEPCLSCQADNPVWEDVCGECGSSQKEEQEQVREKLTAVIGESQALASEHEYEKALKKLGEVQDDQYNFTVDVREQAAEQATLVTAEREKQHQARNELVELSNQYREAHDYAAAVKELEKIPTPLFTQEFEELLTTAQSDLEQQELAREQLQEYFRSALELAEVQEYDTALALLNNLLRGRDEVDEMMAPGKMEAEESSWVYTSFDLQEPGHVSNDNDRESLDDQNTPQSELQTDPSQTGDDERALDLWKAVDAAHGLEEIDPTLCLAHWSGHAFADELREQVMEQFKIITDQRDEQYQLRDELLKRAQKHQNTHDYAATVSELEKIPAPLLTSELAEILEKAKAAKEQKSQNRKTIARTIEESRTLAEKHAYEEALGKIESTLERINEKLPPGYAEDLRKEADEQLKMITDQRDKQHQLRDELLKRAEQHKAKHDYAATVSELEKIPAPLLTTELAEILEKTKAAKEQKEQNRKTIARTIEESQTLAEKHEYEEALGKIENTLERINEKLPPGYVEDLRQEADEQLKMITEQRDEQHQLRDELVERAERHGKTHDYAAVISELEQIPVPLRTGNLIADQFSKATAARDELALLREEITEGVAGFDSFEFKRLPFYELLSKTTRALELKPDDTFFQKTNADMLQRQEKAKRQYEELLEQAEKQFEQCQFEAVSDSAIAWPLEVQEYHAHQKEHADGAETRIEELIDLATKRWAIREDYKAKIRGAPTSRKKIRLAREYLLKEPDDTEFQQLEQQLKAGADIESGQATANWKEMSASNQVSGATSTKNDKKATRRSILARAWSWIDLSRIRRWARLRRKNKLIIAGAALGTVLLIIWAYFLTPSAIKSRAAARHAATLADIADRTKKSLETYNAENAISLQGHSGEVYGLAFSPDGKQIVSSSGDKTLKIWDIESGQETRTLEGHSGAVYCVASSPDGEWIASGSGDRTVKVWDPLYSEEAFTLEGHSGSVYSVAFSPDGRQIVSGSGDKTVKVWDADTGLETFTLEGHSGAVHSVAFSPDGRQIGSGSSDGTVKIWDATTQEETNTFTGHTSPVMSVHFHPYGKRIAIGSGDGTVKVWDTLSGQEPRILNGHSDSVRSVAFSPDGRRIISGSRDGTLRIWSTRNGQELHAFRHHTSTVYCVTASPDGTRLASGGEGQTIKIWHAPALTDEEKSSP